MRIKQRGFTIVEMVVIIVVIGILVSITAMSYSKIRDDASDKSLQSDLLYFAKKAEAFKHQHGNYPLSDSDLELLDAGATHDAYDKEASNLYYCVDSASSSDFSFGAKSRSDTIFYVTSDEDGTIAGDTISASDVCDKIATVSPTSLVGYDGGADAWASWAQ